MAVDLPPIDRPELIFGFVAPIGADVDAAVDNFKSFFQRMKYDVVDIHVTDVFAKLSRLVTPNKALLPAPALARYKSYIAYGNQLRDRLQDNSFLAKTAIFEISRRRNQHQVASDDDRFSNTVYLLHQFKRKEEIDLLREVYGRQFFQVSIYSRRSARVDNLARKFAHSLNKSDLDQFRGDAEEIVAQDTDEKDADSGQSVGKIFHDADFIVNSDISKPDIKTQIERFGELLFGSNSISPSKVEYGMLTARAAALRSLDLSRQVGAAIFSSDGEVIAMGSNEVPKALGGTYWSDGHFDDREFKRGEDSNERRKRELLGEIAGILRPGIPLPEIMQSKAVKDSQFLDALEYGRIIHAEMCAITDAARLGLSVKDATMFVTTFPCHMCAKHIVAAGISKLIFLEPYPKSLAFDLHSDSIKVEGTDRGRYEEFPSVTFEHFCGITPRRYREMFPRGSRKNSDGTFRNYKHEPPIPTIDIRIPIYTTLESIVTNILKKNLRERLGADSSALET